MLLLTCCPTRTALEDNHRSFEEELCTYSYLIFVHLLQWTLRKFFCLTPKPEVVRF